MKTARAFFCLVDMMDTDFLAIGETFPCDVYEIRD